MPGENSNIEIRNSQLAANLPLTGAAAEAQMRRLTRRGFVTGAAAALAGLGAWRWLTGAAPEDRLPWPLRRILRFNEALAEGLGAPHGLAPTFPPKAFRIQPASMEASAWPGSWKTPPAGSSTSSTTVAVQAG